MDGRENEMNGKNKHYRRPEHHHSTGGFWEDKRFSGEVYGERDT